MLPTAPGISLVLTERELLLLFLLRRIAFLADFAFLLGLHAALMIALLAGGFRLFTASFSANDSHAAEQGEGAEDCTDGLHVLPFLPPDSGRRLCLFALEPMQRPGDSALTSCGSITRAV